MITSLAVKKSSLILGSDDKKWVIPNKNYPKKTTWIYKVTPISKKIYTHIVFEFHISVDLYGVNVGHQDIF